MPYFCEKVSLEITELLVVPFQSDILLFSPHSVTDIAEKTTEKELSPHCPITSSTKLSHTRLPPTCPNHPRAHEEESEFQPCSKLPPEWMETQG